jgi:hypothetical protein
MDKAKRQYRLNLKMRVIGGIKKRVQDNKE